MLPKKSQLKNDIFKLIDLKILKILKKWEQLEYCLVVAEKGKADLQSVDPL